MPSLAGLDFVAVIAFEEAQGRLFAYPYYNLALLSVLAGGAVGFQQVDVVNGHGYAHGARLGRHPGKGGQLYGGLGLTKSFHQADAGLLVKGVVNFGV